MPKNDQATMKVTTSFPMIQRDLSKNTLNNRKLEKEKSPAVGQYNVE